MKRILLSIAVGFGLVLICLVVGAVIVLAYSKDGVFDPAVVAVVDLPMRLPKLIYFYFFPPTASDYLMQMNAKRWILAGSFFVSNVLLYSIPPYIFLSIWSRLRKPKPLTSEAPPSPPSFND